MSSRIVLIALTLMIVLGLHVSFSEELHFTLSRLPSSHEYTSYFSIPISLIAIAILAYFSFTKGGMIIAILISVLLLYIFAYMFDIRNTRFLLNLVFVISLFWVSMLPMQKPRDWQIDHTAICHGLWICFAVFMLAMANATFLNKGQGIGWVLPGFIALYDFEQYVGVIYMGAIALLASTNKLNSHQMVLLLVSSFLLAYGTHNLTAMVITVYFCIGMIVYKVTSKGERIIDVLSALTWIIPILFPLFFYNFFVVGKYYFVGSGMFTRFDIYQKVIESLDWSHLFFAGNLSYLGDPHNQFLSYLLSFGVVPGLLVWFYIISLSFQLSSFNRFVYGTVIILPGAVLDLLSHLSTIVFSLVVVLFFRLLQRKTLT